MDFDGWLTLAVVVGVTLAMTRDLAPDFSMLVGLCLLVVGGVLEPEDALKGFSNPAVATIAVMFIVAAALTYTGALRLLSSVVFGKATGRRRDLLRFLVPVSALSAFMNNTPIVAMLIPVVRDYANRVGQSPSRYLIPLAYAAALGGTCTLIGTSGNLVVSGMLQTHGYEPLGMFELTPVAVPTAIVGLLYLTWASNRLISPRISPRASAQSEAREYLAEVLVATDSPLIGQSVEAAGLRHLAGLFLVEIRRADGRTERPVSPADRIGGGDHLVFTGVAATVQDLRRFPGLIPIDDATPEDDDRPLFEVVISHNSPLVGHTVRESGFRRRYDAAILAVHRSGERIDGKIGDIRLEPGDTLMVAASQGFGETWRDSHHFYLVSTVVQAEKPPAYRQTNVAMGTVAVLVALPPLLGISMLEAAMAGLVMLLGTRCITPRVARESVSWSVLVLIGAAFGVAHALDTSGAAAFIASGLVRATAGFGPLGLLAGVYLSTVIFASFISNAAAAALVLPVALTACEAAHLDPRPFAVVVALAASAVFSTPMANATLLVYGPGGYRYVDFPRVGLPLNALCLTIALVLVPWLWPLVPAVG